MSILMPLPCTYIDCDRIYNSYIVFLPSSIINMCNTLIQIKSYPFKSMSTKILFGISPLSYGRSNANRWLGGFLSWSQSLIVASSVHVRKYIPSHKQESEGQPEKSDMLNRHVTFNPCYVIFVVVEVFDLKVNDYDWVACYWVRIHNHWKVVIRSLRTINRIHIYGSSVRHSASYLSFL